jgi:hypothetical protein
MKKHTGSSEHVGVSDLNMSMHALSAEEAADAAGGRFKRNGVFPWYTPPKVIYDDGINVQTTDPSTSNVAYDSPFTPIPRPA